MGIVENRKQKRQENMANRNQNSQQDTNAGAYSKAMVNNPLSIFQANESVGTGTSPQQSYYNAYQQQAKRMNNQLDYYSYVNNNFKDGVVVTPQQSKDQYNAMMEANKSIPYYNPLTDLKNYNQFEKAYTAQGYSQEQSMEAYNKYKSDMLARSKKKALVTYSAGNMLTAFGNLDTNQLVVSSPLAGYYKAKQEEGSTIAETTGGIVWTYQNGHSDEFMKQLTENPYVQETQTEAYRNLVKQDAKNSGPLIKLWDYTDLALNKTMDVVGQVSGRFLSSAYDINNKRDAPVKGLVQYNKGDQRFKDGDTFYSVLTDSYKYNTYDEYMANTKKDYFGNINRWRHASSEEQWNAQKKVTTDMFNAINSGDTNKMKESMLNFDTYITSGDSGLSKKQRNQYNQYKNKVNPADMSLEFISTIAFESGLSKKEVANLTPEQFNQSYQKYLKENPDKAKTTQLIYSFINGYDKVMYGKDITGVFNDYKQLDIGTAGKKLSNQNMLDNVDSKNVFKAMDIQQKENMTEYWNTFFDTHGYNADISYLQSMTNNTPFVDYTQHNTNFLENVFISLATSPLTYIDPVSVFKPRNIESAIPKVETMSFADNISSLNNISKNKINSMSESIKTFNSGGEFKNTMLTKTDLNDFSKAFGTNGTINKKDMSVILGKSDGLDSAMGNLQQHYNDMVASAYKIDNYGANFSFTQDITQSYMASATDLIKSISSYKVPNQLRANADNIMTDYQKMLGEMSISNPLTYKGIDDINELETFINSTKQLSKEDKKYFIDLLDPLKTTTGLDGQIGISQYLTELNNSFQGSLFADNLGKKMAGNIKVDDFGKKSLFQKYQKHSNITEEYQVVDEVIHQARGKQNFNVSQYENVINTARVKYGADFNTFSEYLMTHHDLNNPGNIFGKSEFKNMVDNGMTLTLRNDNAKEIAKAIDDTINIEDITGTKNRLYDVNYSTAVDELGNYQIIDVIKKGEDKASDTHFGDLFDGTLNNDISGSYKPILLNRGKSYKDAVTNSKDRISELLQTSPIGSVGGDLNKAMVDMLISTDRQLESMTRDLINTGQQLGVKMMDFEKNTLAHNIYNKQADNIEMFGKDMIDRGGYIKHIQKDADFTRKTMGKGITGQRNILGDLSAKNNFVGSITGKKDNFVTDIGKYISDIHATNFDTVTKEMIAAQIKDLSKGVINTGERAGKGKVSVPWDTLESNYFKGLTYDMKSHMRDSLGIKSSGKSVVFDKKDYNVLKKQVGLLSEVNPAMYKKVIEKSLSLAKYTALFGSFTLKSIMSVPFMLGTLEGESFLGAIDKYHDYVSKSKKSMNMIAKDKEAFKFVTNNSGKGLNISDYNKLVDKNFTGEKANLLKFDYLSRALDSSSTDRKRFNMWKKTDGGKTIFDITGGVMDDVSGKEAMAFRLSNIPVLGKVMPNFNAFDHMAKSRAMSLFENKGLLNDVSKHRLGEVVNPNNERDTLRKAMRVAEDEIGTTEGRLINKDSLFNKALFFPSFIRKQLPKQALYYTSTLPGLGKMAQMASLVNATQKASGYTRGDLSQLPISQQMSIMLGSPNDSITLNTYDPLQLVSTIGGGSAIETMFGLLNPMLSTPLQLASKQQISTYSSKSSPIGKYIDAVNSGNSADAWKYGIQSMVQAQFGGIYRMAHQTSQLFKGYNDSGKQLGLYGQTDTELYARNQVRAKYGLDPMAPITVDSIPVISSMFNHVGDTSSYNLSRLATTDAIYNSTAIKALDPTTQKSVTQSLYNIATTLAFKDIMAQNSATLPETAKNMPKIKQDIQNSFKSKGLLPQQAVTQYQKEMQSGKPHVSFQDWLKQQ